MVSSVQKREIVSERAISRQQNCPWPVKPFSVFLLGGPSFPSLLVRSIAVERNVAISGNFQTGCR